MLSDGLSVSRYNNRHSNQCTYKTMAVIIHTPEEIEKMRELGRLVAEALDYIG